MADFNYRVRDDKGKAIQGKMSGTSSEVVADHLHDLGYTVIQVKKAGEFFSFRAELPSLSRIKTEDYVMLTSQLSAMIGAGLSLTVALEVLADQTENPRLKSAIATVAEDIRGGASFAEALRKHHGIFSALFINMVAAGEVAGNLDDVLARLTIFIEKQAEIRQKILTALFYPIILLIFSLFVVIFIIITVLPSFVKIFQDAKVPLPLPTLILYKMNLFIRSSWLLIILFLVAAYIGLHFAKKSQTGKAFMDRLILDLPIIGSLARKIEIARFSRTLSALLVSGVPMLQTLETLSRTTENSVFAGVIKDTYEYVRKGGTLSDQLKRSGELPALAVKMAAVGEETGSLDKMMTKVANFYEMSVDYSIKRVTALVEPLLLVFVGGIVGFIMASVILPIFRMVGTLRR
ncbi:MAG: type II secretion system F family protein [Candidatus Margulisiibacteriota bacterium]